jgi:glycine cleavage system H protein
MSIAEKLRYSQDHLWVERQADGTFRAGITDHAQETLGDIVFVDFPTVGQLIKEGQPCGLIESVKIASDLHAPLSGEVTAVNDNLQNNPELINEAPYNAWIFQFQPARESTIDQLLDAEEYRQLLSQ